MFPDLCPLLVQLGKELMKGERERESFIELMKEIDLGKELKTKSVIR